MYIKSARNELNGLQYLRDIQLLNVNVLILKLYIIIRAIFCYKV